MISIYVVQNCTDWWQDLQLCESVKLKLTQNINTLKNKRAVAQNTKEQSNILYCEIQFSTVWDILLRAVFLNLKFPYNQYEIAPFLMTGKAMVQYMAISFAKGVKPLI